MFAKFGRFIAFVRLLTKHFVVEQAVAIAEKRGYLIVRTLISLIRQLGRVLGPTIKGGAALKGVELAFWKKF